MRKTIYILSALLLSLVSCRQIEFEPVELNASNQVEETGLVAVTMQLEIPEVELKALTRANTCSEKPQIDYIYVAVFGTSGYPQAYTLAEPVDADGNRLTSYATENNTPYYFKVLLPVYEGEAHVHIIANGKESIPFADQDEESIMSTMSTTSNVGAFWARVVLEDGILPEKDVNGIMKTDTEGNFEPDTATKNAFKNLVLIRNFAEVKLVNESSDLKEVTWSLVNVPTKGSVAPMAAGTYVGNFKDYTYNPSSGKMVYGTETYNGFVFPDDAMNFTVPAEGALASTPGNPLFLYERSLNSITSSEKPTCILMRAKFQNDSEFSYYRLDLMDDKVEGGYFPIYRNFLYEVKVHMVGNRGAKTPAEAMNRDSGGNVSFTPEAKSLTDISDGISRLNVEYVEKNFTSGGKKTLRVQYIPDVSTGTVNNDGVSIRIKNQGLALKEGTTITELSTSSTTGYKYYQFELNGQDENDDLVSVLEVKADNGSTTNKSVLYRDITLRVLKKMDMTLDLVPNKLDANTKKTVLKIILPDGLPSSIFPLEFHIEDINHTLTPTQKDGNGKTITVPVKTASSLADGTTNSFYYIRTVNESEYNTNHTISTEFEEVTSPSATTVYVANEYFTTKTKNLLNDGMYVYPTSAIVDFNVTSMDIDVEFGGQSSAWSVTVPASSGITVEPSSGTGNGTFTMTFPVNSSTTSSVERTVTVTSGSTSRTVTITQNPLEFSVNPASQTIDFNVTSAEVTVFAPDGIAWTASVSGTGTSLSAPSGTGPQTLTVTLPKNNTTSQRPFTVTATLTDSGVTATAQIAQRRGPNPSQTFNVDSFTYNGNNRSGSATSSDGFVTVGLSTIGNYNPTYNDYIQLGRQVNEGSLWNPTYRPYRGGVTVTPKDGIKITGITITYSNGTYAGYDFGNTRVQVTPGTYTRSGATGTWTGTSDSVISFTNGYQNNQGNYQFPRITRIVVEYEAI